MAYRNQTSGAFVGTAIAAGLILAVTHGGHHLNLPSLTSLARPNSSEHGTLGCSGLEALWEAAGGSAGAASTAASVAMAESSGQQDSTGPVGERGYWQIAPFNAGSSYDPMTNAKAAVRISSDGTDWNPWTTYRTGAYQGRC